jgi:hypothetical protein
VSAPENALGISNSGQRHPGARHYFECGGAILAVLDVSQGGMKPTPGPKSLYFAVDDVQAVHGRAVKLNALAPYRVHGEPASEVIKRPWGVLRLEGARARGTESSRSRASLRIDPIRNQSTAMRNHSSSSKKHSRIEAQPARAIGPRMQIA